MTGETLDTDQDLIELKVAKAAEAKPVGTMSIMGSLRSIQDQYNARLIEISALKKAYDGIKKDLCHALFQNDAAIRVISRLQTEKEELEAQMVQDRAKFAEEAANLRE